MKKLEVPDDMFFDNRTNAEVATYLVSLVIGLASSINVTDNERFLTILSTVQAIIQLAMKDRGIKIGKEITKMLNPKYEVPSNNPFARNIEAELNKLMENEQ